MLKETALTALMALAELLESDQVSAKEKESMRNVLPTVWAIHDRADLIDPYVKEE